MRTYSCRTIGNVAKNNQTQYKNEYNNDNNKNKKKDMKFIKKKHEIHEK